ncbi:NADH-quinone oxidoreductase subunit NuoN [Salinisphaera sp. Q1T1-3]|uniref:NADH-quinone oxidoreductase subunit NuoN n=1 Tax=Salinisphaera sp. Q1T1-3 TaxID=2321229 RepID=UPI000E74551D|nr:NADH-quinone oxidoreductase subunit NuoN [Salinisphaera sp. Q1T1-3]RJS91316.1 NADH-quinone oxidoreductase subunit NuoN [Salinisphaera sp. Q1T1-3]
MNDTWNQVLGALPTIFVAITILAQFLAVTIKRDPRVTHAVTVVGLNLSLLSLIGLVAFAPIAVGPLFEVDPYALFFWAVVLIAGLAGSTFARPYLAGFEDRRDEFYILLVTSVLGAMALIASRHFAGLFIGLELLSIPLYGMIAYTFRTRAALEAAFKYLILSGAASAFLLFGMALLYAASGQLTYHSLSVAAAAGLGTSSDAWLLMGVGMMLVALMFKLSLVPFHIWTPDVYEGAPAPVGAFLATVSKTAVFAVLLRFFVVSPVTDNTWLIFLIGVIAVVSMLVGNLLALRQDNVKRILGYSSIAHIGYLMTAIVAGAPLSIEAVAIYLATYVGTSLGAFGVVALVSSPFSGKDAAHIDHFRGLYYKRPVLAVSMALMMLSLAGIPLTMGFIGKFFILSVAMASGLWWLAGAIIIGSGIALFYYLRVMAVLFMDRPASARELVADAPGLRYGQFIIWLLAALTVLIGIYPSPLIWLASAAGIVIPA